MIKYIIKKKISDHQFTRLKISFVNIPTADRLRKDPFKGQRDAS